MYKCEFCGSELADVEKLDKRLYRMLAKEVASIVEYEHPIILSCIGCKKFFTKRTKQYDILTEMIGIQRTETKYRAKKPNIKASTLGYSNEIPSKLTAKKVGGIINNIVYVGIGDYEKVIDDDLWIKANTTAMKIDGIDQYLANVVACVETSFNVVFTNKDEWIYNAINKIKEIGAEDFLKMYIAILRDLFRAEITSHAMELPLIE